MNEDPQDGVDERRLHLLREAEAEDGRTYCPPLRDYNMRPLGAGSEVRQRTPSTHIEDPWIIAGETTLRDVDSLYGITDENAPRVLKAIFEDDAERKGFGVALAVWACVMGGGILLAYGIHWAWNALTGGV